MGIALAWPNALFSCLGLEVMKVADFIGHTTPVPGGQFEVWRWRLLNTLVRTLRRCLAGKEARNVEDAADLARRRKNRVLFAHLRRKDVPADEAEACVGTYHMPCLLGGPAERMAMAMHATTLNTVSKRFQALVMRRQGRRQPGRGVPVLLAGDFNIKSTDVCLLDALKMGRLTGEFGGLAKSLSRERDGEATPLTFRSAYASHSSAGREPEFTNNAWPTFNDEPFRETLDYILYADGGGPNGTMFVAVDAVKQLPSLADLRVVNDSRCGLPSNGAARELGTYPDFAEPSDHLLIAADLSFVRV